MTSEERSEPSKVQDESIGAHGRDVVTKLSPWSVADTVTRLLAVVACQRANGVRDDRSQRRSGERWIAPPRHQAGDLWKPRPGTPVIQAAPLAAEILIWASSSSFSARCCSRVRSCTRARR